MNVVVERTTGTRLREISPLAPDFAIEVDDDDDEVEEREERRKKKKWT